MCSCSTSLTQLSSLKNKEINKMTTTTFLTSPSRELTHSAEFLQHLLSAARKVARCSSIPTTLGSWRVPRRLSTDSNTRISCQALELVSKVCSRGGYRVTFSCPYSSTQISANSLVTQLVRTQIYLWITKLITPSVFTGLNTEDQTIRRHNKHLQTK